MRRLDRKQMKVSRKDILTVLKIGDHTHGRPLQEEHCMMLYSIRHSTSILGELRF